jgi:hypothetical protein
VYLEHHCDFLISGTSAPAVKLNSTIINGYKQILGKFGEIQREFVDAYSPDSDNDCRGGGGGHQHLHPPCARFLHSFREIIATKMPVHHLLEQILNEYIVAAGLQSRQPLFQSVNSIGTAVTRRALNRYNAWAAIRKRARAAGFSPPSDVTPPGQLAS